VRLAPPLIGLNNCGNALFRYYSANVTLFTLRLTESAAKGNSRLRWLYIKEIGDEYQDFDVLQREGTGNT
jgi:hypothetical protein